MTADSSEIVPLAAPRSHGLTLGEGQLPDWKDSWAKQIPLIGGFLNLVLGYPGYVTNLEDVADFTAEDLEVEDSRWQGRKVGMRRREKAA